MSYRVRLLGPLETFAEDGTRLAPPTGQQLRTLVSLAMRPGNERSDVFLQNMLWGRDDYNPPLPPIISKVRAWIPLSKQTPGTRTYKTLLQRSDVDASDFIDRVAAAGSPIPVGEADELLGLWRGDPASLFDFLDPSEFNPLARARAELIAQLSTWSRTELGKLTNLEAFRMLFEDDCRSLPLGERPRAKRLLVVDDDPALTDMLAELLRGYQCVPAHNLGEAMDLVTDPSVTLAGALVDLHLTKHLDSQGLQVLDALREHRPEVPRVLLTSSPMADGMSYVTTQYGLYEILVKNGNDAPTRTRRTVDKMMSDSAESNLLRARATLDTLSSSVMQTLQRRAVSVRQHMRRGEASAEDLSSVIEEMENAERSIEEAKSALQGITEPTDASAAIAAFKQQWVGLLERRGSNG